MAEFFAAEVFAMLDGAGIDPSDPMFQALIAAAAAGSADAVEAMLLEAYRTAITHPISPAALEAMKVRAASNAKTLATQMTQGQLKKIAETVNAGLKQGLGRDGIAAMLDTVKGLDAVRAKSLLKFEEALRAQGLSEAAIKKKVDKQFKKLLQDRKEVIAQTESAHATSEARRVAALERGAGFHKWYTSEDSKVSNDCRANADDGAISIEDSFSGGVMRPPQHPRCRCRVVYATTKETADLL